MSINKFSNNELQKEWEHLLFLLNHNKDIYVKITPQEKGTSLVNIYVLADETSKRKTDFIAMDSKEIYFELKDEDREVCSKAITQALNGLHWKCSKGYNRSNNTEYYIKPDWKYWYSLKGK